MALTSSLAEHSVVVLSASKVISLNKPLPEKIQIINALCSYQRLPITAHDIIFPEIRREEVDLFVMCIWSQLDSLSHFSYSHYLRVLCHTNGCWRRRWILCGSRWQAGYKWKLRASSQHMVEHMGMSWKVTAGSNPGLLCCVWFIPG